jgi:DNA-binding XRE family transcriptional regulator
MNKEERKAIQHQKMDKLVEYLPVLRSAARITQNQLGKRLGIARSTVVVIEHRQRQLQLYMYLAIVLIFMQNEDSKKLLESFELFDKDFINNIM